MEGAGGGSWYDAVVPLSLLLIMVCMGMELALADFRRVLEMPRAVAIGLVGQLALLPLVGLGCASLPGLPSEIAIGIVIITACPGGAMSNVFSYLARANIALSVTLTTLSSTVCFVTIPLWINLGVARFGQELAVGGASLRLPVGPTVAQLFAVTLLPVAIGMGLRARWPARSERARVPLRRAMALVMATVMLSILASEWETLVRDLETAAVGALLLVSGMLAVAYALARVGRIGHRDAFTISIEVGLQNGALATLVVVNLLGRPGLMVFPGVYAVLSFVPVTVWALAMRRRLAPAAAASGGH